MAPQSLKSLTMTGAAVLNPDCMSREPVLAAKVAECIARWSNTESFMASLLAHLIDSKDNIATEIYIAANVGPVRFAILDAAAKGSLSERDYALFKCVMKVVRAAAEKRNILAHRVWGWCPELKGYLLLVDAKVLPRWHTHHYLAGKGVPFPTALGNIHEQIMAYNINDLVEIESDLKKAGEFLDYFVRSFDRSWPGHELLLDKLRQDPLIQSMMTP